MEQSRTEKSGLVTGIVTSLEYKIVHLAAKSPLSVANRENLEIVV